jgi:serine/threonine-protein kinase
MPTASPDADRNLLFGVLALQADLLDADRFAEACTAWSVRKDTPLADLLVQRGRLRPDERAHVEFLLDRKLQKHGGDPRSGLADAASQRVRLTLDSLTDPDVRHTLTALEPAGAAREKATIHYKPVGRDRYTLTRLHAKGGIGQVWVAHDTDLGREVALKELLDGRAADPGALARFLEEAKITGQLEHPNIVPVYELARPEGAAPLYTMRFVRGRTLAAAVKHYHRKRQEKEAGALDLRELLSQFVAVCNAVDYAHSRGVLHRDLKPSNVILGNYGEVIVLDWGLAKLKTAAETASSLLPVSVGKESSHDATVQGQVLGTPSYMPPEQAQGRLDLLDEHSDVYALGAVLYEILTGEPPFTGADTAAILVQVVSDPPVPPRRKVSAVPAALEAVCLKALAKKPADRYDSVADLAHELRRWLADEPVTAYREPWPARAGRWARRHRTGVTTAMAATLVLLVSLGVATTLLGAANERERRAAAAAEERGREAQAERNEAALQRDEAARQRDEATRQRDRAAERFRLAREAVDQFHTQVSESPELKARDLEGLRTKLLESAARFYEKFAKEAGGDVEVRAERGRAYHRLAMLYGDTGQKEKAEAAFQEALAVHQGLAADYPGEPVHRHDLARTCIDQAEFFRKSGNWTGRRNGPGIEATGRAITLLRELLKSSPKNPDYRFDLAEALNDMGAFTGPRDVVWKEAQALALGLTEEYPSVAKYQHFLALTYNQFAYLHNAAGRYAEGDDAGAKGIAISRQLVKDYPLNVEYQDTLTFLLGNRSWGYRKTGRPDLALEATKEGVAIARGQAEAHPSVHQYQIRVAQLLASLANHYESTGKKDLTLPLREEVLSRRERVARDFPDDVGFRVDMALSQHELAVSLRGCGRAKEAQTHAEASAKEEEAAVRLASARPEQQNELARLLRTAGSWLEKTDPARKAELEARAKALDAVAGWRREVDAREKSAKEGDANSRGQLGNALMNLGVAYGPLDPARSAEACQRAVAVWEKLVSERPGDAGYRSNLATSYEQQALAHQRAKETDKAEAAYGKALAIREGLARESAGDAGVQDRLAFDCVTLGQLRWEAGRLPEAEAILRQGQTAAEKAVAAAPALAPARERLSMARALLGVVLAGRGDHAAAAAEAEAAAKASESGPSRYNTARALARASAAARADDRLPAAERAATADRHAARAMALLAAAETSGYFKDANARDQLGKDDDLKCLRDRDDFKKLVDRVTSAANAPGK